MDQLPVRRRPMNHSGFEDKLLARLDRLDPDQIQNYLTHVLGQRQFLQTIFDHLDEGILVTDASLRVLFANRKSRQMLGLSRSRPMIGESLLARLPADHPLTAFLEDLRENLRPIESYEFTVG